ncbi:STAS/SEC14 domain-containing protein [Mameliella alba]|uniref:STAS/SEC14 domain-containing protein n=1 Tax=Mameliella alba TaxID=561184 RepID=UPI000B52C8FD|nr:STAS/SEC14 domain-containing protein [Mameliella alba]MBY6122216.1 STAS/SEC14 domain-containing protein [Mameliella alba]OWV39784.1 STAS/SEC14 domain-containing protein [Mameliella alba]OWV55670.1 STAS/SEC14 domain-containing protein [Mameliella alba]
MIEVQTTGHPGLYEVQVSGVVSDTDYAQTLVPALEAAIEEHERIRVLVIFGPDFRDFTLGALFDDARMGLRHWRGFDRLAVVTDKPWIRRAVTGLSVLMPCPVRVFPLEQAEDARRWMSESLGAIHQIDLGDGVLHIQLRGQLDSAIYAAESGDLDAFIRANDRFRLLIDARDFDGWQGLGALFEHLKVVRDHYRLIDRAAIVGNAAWQRLGERALRTFSGADTRFFTADEFETAKVWIKG